MVLFRYGLDHLPSNRTAEIFKFYTIHEKKYGERAGIENVIVSKRRFQYEKVRFILHILIGALFS